MIYHIVYDTADQSYLIKREDNSYQWLSNLNEPLRTWRNYSKYGTFSSWLEHIHTLEEMQYLGSCTDIPSFITDHPEHFI